MRSPVSMLIQNVWGNNMKRKSLVNVLVLLMVLILSIYVLLWHAVFAPNHAAIFTTTKGKIITIVEYTNITNTLRQFEALSNNTLAIDNCEASSYKLIHHGCCMVQFSMSYLYSLGFTDIEGLNRRSANIKTMTNAGNNNLGCYGVNIVENARFKMQRFKNVRLKARAYSTIIKYCETHNILSYCQSFLPVTYNLNIKEERIDFFRQLKCSNGSTNKLYGSHHHCTWPIICGVWLYGVWLYVANYMDPII
eukprot:419227_1